VVLPGDLAKALREVLALGAKPEVAYNESSSPDATLIEIAPPPKEYVYLVLATISFGSDGDSVEFQALCTDGEWRTLDRPVGLASTSLVKSYPNLKLDCIIVGNTRYEVRAGDGITPTFRVVSRGRGPWRCQVIYFTDP